MPCSYLGYVIILMLSLWHAIHFGYRSAIIYIFHGIKLTCMKVNQVGTYLTII
jgi:hypothetical protein